MAAQANCAHELYVTVVISVCVAVDLNESSGL